MSLRLIGATVVCLLALCACAEAVVCASCTGTCPKPPDCPLGREPCGCCDVCALTMGQLCHGDSPGCGPGLMCLTPVGPFPLRPPPGSSFHGRCVMSSIPNFSPTTHLAPTLPRSTYPVPTIAGPTFPVPTIPGTTFPVPTIPTNSTIAPKMVG